MKEATIAWLKECANNSFLTHETRFRAIELLIALGAL